MKGMDMDGYSDQMRYTLTFAKGGYLHKMKVEAWTTADIAALALSARCGTVTLTNRCNGAKAAYKDGFKLWHENGIEDLTA
jgi:hypothetical protein